MDEQKAVIKDTDMLEEMQQQAVQCAVRSLEEHSPECSVAAHIKRVNVSEPGAAGCWALYPHGAPRLRSAPHRSAPSGRA